MMHPKTILQNFNTVSYTHLDVYKRQTIHQVSVGIGKILCVNTIGDNEELNEMIQPVVGVLLITHDLIDCLADVNATAL